MSSNLSFIDAQMQGPVTRYLSKFPEDKRDSALAYALEYGILKLSDILENVGVTPDTQEKAVSPHETIENFSTPKHVKYPDWWGHREHIPSPGSTRQMKQKSAEQQAFKITQSQPAQSQVTVIHKRDPDLVPAVTEDAKKSVLSEIQKPASSFIIPFSTPKPVKKSAKRTPKSVPPPLKSQFEPTKPKESLLKICKDFLASDFIKCLDLAVLADE